MMVDIQVNGKKFEQQFTQLAKNIELSKIRQESQNSSKNFI